jgi:hypothetical protein
MALWQFAFDLIPASAARVSDVTAIRLDDSLRDVSLLNFSNAEIADLIAHLSTLLPEAQSWNSSLRIWGNEKSNDIQVWFQNSAVEFVQFRLDASTLSLRLVGGICELARRFGCLLVARDGAIIQPRIEPVVKAVLRSPAMKFVQDPDTYLAEARLLDPICD